jgi:hypothetical protein
VRDLRDDYRQWMFTVDPRNLIFIDETGMHLGFTRLYGRSAITALIGLPSRFFSFCYAYR